MPTPNGRISVGTMVTVAALGLGAALVPVAAAGPASAAGGLHCLADYTIALSPGVSVAASSGTLSTPDAGVLTCDGMINGHRPTGQGTYLEPTGTYHDSSCLNGSGEYTYSMAIPTDAGEQKSDGSGTFAYPQLPSHGGLVGGTFRGDKASGTFDFTPTAGDCVANAVTKAHVIIEYFFN